MTAPASPTLTATAGPSVGAVTLTIGAVAGAASYALTRLADGETDPYTVAGATAGVNYDVYVDEFVVYTYSVTATNAGAETSTATTATVKTWSGERPHWRSLAQRLNRGTRAP